MECASQLHKNMALNNTKRSRMGVSVTILAVITIGGGELLRQVAFPHRYNLYLCIGLGVVGLLVSLKSLASGHKTREFTGPLDWLMHAPHWGVVLCLSAPLLFVLTTNIRSPLPKLPVAAASPRPQPAVPEEVVEKPAPGFPPLKLNALIFEGTNSTVSINKKTLRVGERVEGVQVLAIDRKGVLVEFGGQTKLLTPLR